VQQSKTTQGRSVWAGGKTNVTHPEVRVCVCQGFMGLAGCRSFHGTTRTTTTGTG